MVANKAAAVAMTTAFAASGRAVVPSADDAVADAIAELGVGDVDDDALKTSSNSAASIDPKDEVAARTFAASAEVDTSEDISRTKCGGTLGGNGAQI